MTTKRKHNDLVMVLLVVTVLALLWFGAKDSISQSLSTPSNMDIPTATNYNDAGQLGDALLSNFNDLPNQSDKATAVNCVSEGTRIYDCNFTFTSGAHVLNAFTVSEDGQSYVSKAGQ